MDNLRKEHIKSKLATPMLKDSSHREFNKKSRVEAIKKAVKKFKEK